MVLVGEDVLPQHRMCLREPSGLALVLALDLIDGDLRPDQDPVPVGQLFDLRVERVVGADHRCSERSRPGDQLAQLGRGERPTGLQARLVDVHAAQVQQPPVQLEPAGRRDRDAADAAVGHVTAKRTAVGVRQGQARPIQKRVVRGPQVRMGDADLRRCGPGGVRGDPPSAEVQSRATVGAAQQDGLRGTSEVADRYLLLHAGRAGGAGQHGPHDGLGEVGALHRAEVHLAQQPAVVPPATARTGRQIGRCAAVIDTHDQAVDPGPQALEIELEGKIGAGVAPDLASVQPHCRAIVDRLKANDPTPIRRRHIPRERRARQREIPPVPAHRSRHAGGREIPRVVRVGHCNRRPTVGGRHVAPPALGVADVGRVRAEQPRAPQQVAVSLTIAVERPLGRRLRDIDGRALRVRGAAHPEPKHDRDSQRSDERPSEDERP